MKKHLPKGFVEIQAALLTVNMIWGTSSAVIKYSLQYFTPISLLFVRFLIVSTLILPYIYIELKKIKVDKRDYLNLFLLGVFSQTTLLITFWAYKLTSAIDVAVIGIFSTILSIYAAHYFFKEKVDKRLKIGLIVTFAGTLIIIFEPILQGLGLNGGAVNIWQRLLGNILALVYAVTWVIFVIWSKMSMGESSIPLKNTLKWAHIKPFRRKYPPILIAFVTFYVGLATLLPLFLIENYFNPNSFNIAFIPPLGWAGVIFLAVFASIIAYTLNQWSLHNGKVSDIAIWAYGGTIFAFPASYLILGEIPSKIMLVGGLIIIAGVGIAESRNP